ncbi:uncharacterized protein LOC110769974 [Prunus avium]|uniref:Uncharacterized protein LOC110769974 n=1 Tax=Prunus avium TaxID=42229 RepID=A0A6P5TRE2_PRUAV|nr:uncharacterized protein LOC110769974 [Prunus avium]
MGLIWFFFFKEGPYSDWSKLLVELLGLSDQLATLQATERTHSQTYIGCMKKGLVITDPKMKWYEKSRHLIGNEYFRMLMVLYMFCLQRWSHHWQLLEITVSHMFCIYFLYCDM